MGTSVFSSPIKEVIGDAASPLTLATTVPTTTTAHLIEVQPGFHEALVYCASQWKLLLTPKMKHCVLYNASTFTDYIAKMVDKAVTPVLTLSSMTTTWALYLGFADQISGLAVDMTADVNGASQLASVYYWNGAWTSTSVTDNTVSSGKTLARDGTMTWTVPTDEVAVSLPDTFTATLANDTGTATGSTITMYAGTTVITVTGSGAFTVTLPTHGMSGVARTTHADQLTVTSSPVTLAGGAQSVTATLAAGVTSATFAIDLKTTCPAIPAMNWYKIVVDGALDSATTVERILGINKGTNYAYMEGGVNYQFSVNDDKVGALQVLSVSGTPALDCNWIKH